MTANVSNSCLDYLDRLVDEYNNNYHRSTSKKTVPPGCSTLPGEMESNNKAPQFHLDDRIKITRGKNIFSKGCTENWSKEKYFIDLMLNTNPWTYTIKDLNRKKLLGSFHKKE